MKINKRADSPRVSQIHFSGHLPEITQNSREGNDPIDTFLFGRVTYDMMASFWPTPAGKSANPVFAEALNNTPKIVFSATLKKADWQNTEVVQELTKETSSLTE